MLKGLFKLKKQERLKSMGKTSESIKLIGQINYTDYLRVL
jgi:hypothetical protein